MYLSIITIAYNDINGLKKTAESILPLPDNCEWLIVDGGSTDGTVELLNTLPRHSNISYVSELDEGIYDAMNKGILASSGQYLSFMNSGDCYHREQLEKVCKLELATSDIIAFNCSTVMPDGTPGKARQFPSNLSEIEAWACIQHQSTLYSRKVFETLGLYDLNYRFLADYEHVVRAYKNQNISFELRNDEKLSIFLLDGVSTNIKTSSDVWLEYKKIQQDNFGSYSYRLAFIYIAKSLLSYLPFGERAFRVARNVFLRER
ncbi:glycosyltransferase family 2 protein [Vibrio sp. RE88]|uniref:glycosyltransferase family 2 protein n=1 Tax=Vibrio sp. RE88 TaxID=2607610 RepID=UPI001493DB09|nr:glycosyltransferase family 2 protein [Vibrio sp. RE88]NOH63931.1 glycosyltransferase [Vibrio sp. RE88]